ncbi:CBS domain-containing protein [Ectothiorhodospiraceae bacterium WFHF3C12]|nr:CBS domain-containing protein [Ectothiorhodospiraceae bacterium WFHF3C12]
MPQRSQAKAEDDDIQHFLSRHAPFDQMAARHRHLLAESAEVLQAATGEALLRPGDGRVTALYIVMAGQVEGIRESASDDALRLGPGECFPLGALLGERATRTEYRAAGDLRYLRLNHDGFVRLFKESQVFRDYCIRGVSSLLEQVQHHIQAAALQNMGAETTFDTELGRLVHMDPVSCPPRTSIRDAVQLMHRNKVGSIVVVDDQHRPAGIFTLHDLRARIADHGDLDGTIETAMTPNPQALSEEALAFEAVMLMAQRHIRHIIVTTGGRLAGVISERDLFALQRINVVHIMRTLSDAPTVQAVVTARSGIGHLIEGMMAHGAAVGQITRIITLLNDRTTHRVIDLCSAEHEVPAAFSWLSFGSEGRGEQTLVTDQDNGILFNACGDDAEAIRQRFLPFARAVNEALDRCGFPLCKGNVMASNPKLCLSVEEWHRAFYGIIDSQTPENLLRSSIYFDLRCLYGDEGPVQALQRDVLEKASKTSLFLHMMAGNTLRNRPPLGFLRDFVTERSKEAGGDTLDLKLRGTAPFVDAARLLSLEGGLTETNTMDRFQAIADAGLASRGDVEAWAESFAFIQMIRMRHNLEQARQGQTMNNRLDPDELNPMDRHILKEAFKQCRGLQKKIEVRYQVQ